MKPGLLVAALALALSGCVGALMLDEGGGGSYPPPQRLPELSQAERDGGCTLTVGPAESDGLITVRCPPGATYNGGIAVVEHVSWYCTVASPLGSLAQPRPAKRFRYDHSGNPIRCQR